MTARGAWALRERAGLSLGDVAWDVFGDGPAVVLVHGTPTWSFLWRHVVPPLADSFEVYLFDLPGYGDSPAPQEAEVAIPLHSATLVELLDVWQLESPAIAGHDVGGATVLGAHLVHGRQFSRIALLDAVVFAPWITPTTRHVQAHLDTYLTMPSHIFEQVTAAHLRTAVHRGFAEHALAAYQAPWAGERGRGAYLRKVAAFDEAHTREIERSLGTIRTPVRVIWGAEDAWLDPALGRRLRDAIPGAELALIEQAGHFCMEDAPEQVARELLDFFGAPR